MNIITKPSESRRGENNFFKKKTNKQTKKRGQANGGIPLFQDQTLKEDLLRVLEREEKRS